MYTTYHFNVWCCDYLTCLGCATAIVEEDKDLLCEECNESVLDVYNAAVGLAANRLRTDI
jgi:hypothetical protein